MTDRIEELQRLHEAATEEWHAEGFDVDGEGFSVAECYREADASLIAAMRNALPALLRVARAARQMRKAMTTPPKGYGDGHQGYWWTAATEKAAEEVAEAVAELEKP
jgi:hypothetical protein